MSDVTAGDSSATPTDSSATVNSPDSGHQTPTKETQPKTVSWEEHQKLLNAYSEVKNDLFKHKDRSKAAEAKIGDLEAQRLKEKEDYKTLWENAQKTAEVEVEKQQKLAAYVERTNKFNEVRAKAMQAGLRSEAASDLELLDLNSVRVEVTSDNRYIVHGADDFVSRLKNDKPHWFQDNRAPSVNSGRGGSAPTEKLLTVKDMVEIERQYRAGRMDRDDYLKKHEQYAKDSAKEKRS